MSCAICPRCAREHPEGARFCNGCGTALTLATCARCEAINAIDATHCHQCGALLRAAEAKLEMGAIAAEAREAGASVPPASSDARSHAHCDEATPIAFAERVAREPAGRREPSLSHEPSVLDEPSKLQEPSVLHEPPPLHEPSALHEPPVPHEASTLHEPSIPPALSTPAESILNEPSTLREPWILHEPSPSPEPWTPDGSRIVPQPRSPARIPHLALAGALVAAVAAGTYFAFDVPVVRHVVGNAIGAGDVASASSPAGPARAVEAPEVLPQPGAPEPARSTPSLVQPPSAYATPPTAREHEEQPSAAKVEAHDPSVVTAPNALHIGTPAAEKAPRVETRAAERPAPSTPASQTPASGRRAARASGSSKDALATERLIERDLGKFMTRDGR